MGKMFQNASSLKPLGQLKPNCPGMIIGRSSTMFLFLCRSKSQDGRHRRTQINIGSYGKMFKCLLLRNYKYDQSQTVHECSLDGPLQSLRFCSDMKFKMAATAGLSLTLDPMEFFFQNDSSLKPLGQLKPNCPGMIIGRSFKEFPFYMPIGNPRWPPPQYID